MRVLLLSNSYPLSPLGATILAFGVRQMALALQQAGAEVCVVTPDRAGPKQADPGLKTHWFPWSGRDAPALIKLNMASLAGLRRAWSLFRNGRRAARKLCGDFRPDICLAAWALPSGYFARHAKRRCHIPYAVWCLGSDIHTWAKKPFFRGLTRRVLNDADLLYADGFALSRDVTALCGRPCEFLATTRVLVELAEEPPELAPDKTHFLYVGRWEKVKGLDVLLDAWRLIAERGLAGKALLHVAGQGQGLERRLSEAARDANLKGSVRIVGWATEAQLAGLYRAVDCVVIPSRNESIPVVLSEALGADTPLIVTNVGDMGTIVKRYQLGYVVPPESPSTLADAIAAFLARPHVFDRSKLADARRLFDIDQSARTFLAHACRIVGRPFHTTSGQEASACEKP